MSSSAMVVPPQSVFIDPRSFAVLGPNGHFRQNSFTEFFNPTSTSPPFFQIFDSAFLDIIGHNPTFNQVAFNATFAFTRDEAPIFNPSTGEVFFASNIAGDGGVSHWEISLPAMEAALQALQPNNRQAVNVPVTEINLPDSIQITNGGTGPLDGNLVLITSGHGPLPPSVALVDPNSNNVTVLLDNFFGRQFNSLNDIKTHPTSGALFFTDPSYGFRNHFHSPPLLPNQVYRLDIATRSVRVVATDFDECNGIAFDSQGKIAYVADSGAAIGGGETNQTKPATIYAYDVDPRSQVFLNRQVFAYVDAGIPDGIQIDSKGNVYPGCRDGVEVWSPQGVLLGKFFIGSASSNFVFAGDGRLVILAETKIFLAQINLKAKASKLVFP